MKFLVIAGPATWANEKFATDPKIAEIAQKGFEFYGKLEAQGKLEHYVRLDGPPGSVMIFNVESLEEFAKLRAEDPFVPLLGDNIKVIPLAKSPAGHKLMKDQAERLHK